MTGPKDRMVVLEVRGGHRELLIKGLHGSIKQDEYSRDLCTILSLYSVRPYHTLKYVLRG